MVYIYCDESRQDLLVKKEHISKNNQYVCIGGIMTDDQYKELIKREIKSLQEKHNVYGEIKWGNVSNNKVDFYIELIDLFFKYDKELEFRVVIIDSEEVDNEVFNCDDHELGYYKFYYQLLYHWINPKEEYYIFTDYKTNKDKTRLKSLKEIINKSYHKDCVKIIQSINSKESLLLQLENILMGAIGYKFNYGSAGKSCAKNALVNRIEKHLGHEIIPTLKNSKKFNVFKIALRKGRF